MRQLGLHMYWVRYGHRAATAEQCDLEVAQKVKNRYRMSQNSSWAMEATERRTCPPLNVDGRTTEKAGDQSRGLYVRDDVLQRPVDYVPDCLNVVVGQALQAHAEVGLPGVAVVPGTREESMLRARALPPLAHRTLFKEQLRQGPELRAFTLKSRTTKPTKQSRL